MSSTNTKIQNSTVFLFIVMLITSSCLPKSDIQISIQKASNSTPPVAILSGVETFYNGSESLNISVSSTNPSDISSYRYKIGGASIDCIDPTGYSAEIPTSFPIIDNISSFTSNTTTNNTKLCVLAIDSSGKQQSYSEATSASWVTDIEGTVATLNGLPASSDNALNVTVSADTPSELVSYKYKIGPQSTTDCSFSTGYSAALAKAVDIENDLTSFDDVPMRLCVVSIDTAGNEQALGSATSSDWLLTRTKISTGYYSACMIDRLGDLRCWGDNNTKPLGAGASGSMLPTIVDPGVKYKEISSGWYHTCGITTTGTLKCWGLNNQYQLGDGTQIKRSILVVIDPGVSYKEIATGFTMTCGITVAGELKCWGTNNSGIGNGFYSRSTPALIDSGTSYQKVSIGANNNVCATTSTNALKCWGPNHHGQVGDLTTTTRLTPTLIHSGTLYKDISIVAASTCALTIEGVVKCWGANVSGTLGNGTTISSLSAVIADSGVNYNSLTKSGAGTSTLCGITTNGSLKCWGSNGYGQVGDTTSTSKTSPTLIDGSEKYSYVSNGNSSSCGVKTNGEIKCWGNGNSKILGSDYYGYLLTPSLVTSPLTFSNLPTGNSSNTLLDITLSSPGASPGFTTTAYKYKIVYGGINCIAPAGYSSARPLTDHIVEDISSLPDGNIGLCVQKINEFGNSESLSVVTQKTWRKVTVATLSIDGEIGTYGYGFGIVDSGSSAIVTLTLTNIGPLTAENISFGIPSSTINFNYTGGVFPGESGDCTSTLTPGSGCTIQLTYSPLSADDTDSIVINYDNGVSSNSFTINLGGQLRVYGCMSSSYPNYNPSANTEDNSCSTDLSGCTDSTATNYNPSATIDDGSCTYNIPGCMHPNAINYNPSATIDDGSCIQYE